MYVAEYIYCSVLPRHVAIVPKRVIVQRTLTRSARQFPSHSRTPRRLSPCFCFSVDDTTAYTASYSERNSIMATVSASQPSRFPSPEIIDVDALEEDAVFEDTVVFSGFHGHPRQLPPHRPSAGPSSVGHHPTDDEVTFTGFRRRSPRRALRTSRSAQAGPSHSSAAGPSEVIVVDSDEEMPSSSSRIRRRSFSMSNCRLTMHVANR